MGRKYIDLTGQTINGIKVIGIVDEKGGLGKHRRWNCICPKCNNHFIVASQHLRDKEHPISMCRNCSLKEYDDLTGKKFGRLTVLSRYNDTHNKRVVFKCKCECGSIVSVQGNHLTTGEIISCGCVISKSEEIISDLLQRYNVRFDKQKTFNECKDKAFLRFDFYLVDYNSVIEYQGIQHFEPINMFGGYEKFLNQIRRDRIKKEFCCSAGIKYYEITYKDNIEEKLLGILSNEDIVWPYGNIVG